VQNITDNMSTYNYYGTKELVLSCGVGLCKVCSFGNTSRKVNEGRFSAREALSLFLAEIMVSFTSCRDVFGVGIEFRNDRQAILTQRLQLYNRFKN
jgi:hypothetical protein